MKEWTKDIEIEAPIDKVWDLLNGSLENIKKIMPQVIANEPITITETGVGSIYRQKYKEGNRVQEYDVKTLEFLDTPDHKKLKVGFTLAKLFEITAYYELKKVEDGKTWFRYTATNNPLKWFIKLLIFLASDKIVVKFVERVKKVAEGENGEIKG